MSRRLALLLLILSLAAVAATHWLLNTGSGLTFAVRLASSLSEDHLLIEQATGRLSGPLSIGRLHWQDGKNRITATDVTLAWTPRALFDHRLQVESLTIDSLHINIPESDEPAGEPDDLQLPLALLVEQLRIAKVSYGTLEPIRQLSLRVDSDGRQHRIENLHLLSGNVAVRGQADIDGAAPFTLKAEAEIQGQLENRPLALALNANGPLAGLIVELTARAGIEGKARLLLTPFAAMPFAEADIELGNIDPAAWRDGLPDAHLDLNLKIKPEATGVSAHFDLINQRAATIDKGGVPLDRLSGQATWQNGQLAFPELRARLGGGELSGQGVWQGELDSGALQLELTVRQLDAIRLLGKLRPTRLNGKLTASLGQASQKIRIDLRDQRFTLRGTAHHESGTLTLKDIEIAAGKARLLADGSLLQAGQTFRAEARLLEFDPSRFAELPPARINASLQVSGKLQPELLVDARFALTDSQFRGHPLTGQGELRLDWPRLDGVDLNLTLAGNRIAAKGGFGSPGQGLDLDIDAPALAALGGQGSLTANLRLTGSPVRHQLELSGAMGEQSLQLRINGSEKDGRWQGTLEQLALRADSAARNLRLRSPAALSASAEGWSVGPLQLAGDPLDWLATLQAEADHKALKLDLQASGSRIGRVHADLRAGMDGPWQLAGSSPWQGQAEAAITDLGWLGELLGETWQTGGQLDARLQLTGSPDQPTLGGTLNGQKLSLRLPAQQLALTDGELVADIGNNLLSIRRLSFSSLRQRPPRALRLALGSDAGRLEGPGRLEISGEMRVGPEQPEGQAALSIRLDRVGVWQRQDQWVSVSGEGKLRWQESALGIDGQLAIDAAYWQLAPAGAPRLSDDVVVHRPGDQAAAALRPSIELDVNTDLGRHFLFEGAGLSTRLAGQVRLTASGRDLPRASGTIRTRDGRFEAYGQRLESTRGIVTFRGLPDNPALDVRAVRKGLPVEPGVQLSGTAQRPVVRLISDPDLPDSDKLSWLILGHGPENMGAGDASLLLSAAGGLLGNDSGNLVQQLKRSFGIDEFGIRQGNLDGSGSRQPGSRVVAGSVDTAATTGNQILSVGKRLSSSATLSYEQSLGTAESIVKLSIALTREITLIARAGSDNAVDLFYTLTWGRPPGRRTAAPQGAASDTP